VLAPPEVAFARNGPTHLAHQVAGSGPPDMVFVGGASAMSLAWEDPSSSRGLRRMASFSRLVTFDQRGVGLSDRIPPDTTPTMYDLVGDLEAVVAASGGRDPVLFGFHNGGAVATVYASRHPVRGLVLCNTWARLARADDFPIGVPDWVLDRLQERYETEWGEGRIHDEYGTRRSRAESKHSELAATNPDQHAPMFRFNRSYDIRAVLPTIAVPTLVVHTEENDMVRPAQGRYLAENIPGARLVLVPGSDHAFLRTGAERVIDEVESFVTGSVNAFDDRIRMVMLFTDIVDSTPLAADLGDKAWRVLIDEHNARMLRLVEEMDGNDIKSTGDGFLVAFDESETAIRCAHAAMEAMAGLGLVLRAGVHLGEVSRMGSHDVSGLAVHFAQRLCARAARGQVLVSDAVREACGGTAIRFEERGKAELKGIPGQWEVFEARV
jgi:pimeloyl-ACP methyl ester carboxylesterase